MCGKRAGQRKQAFKQRAGRKIWQKMCSHPPPKKKMLKFAVNTWARISFVQRAFSILLEKQNLCTHVKSHL